MKIFAVSDIHSYYTIFHNTLKDKGFEENNPDHLLVVCGDMFDRGPDTIQVKEYLDNLTNVVLVKGNHESLIEEMWERGRALGHDISNGTLQSAEHILDHLEKQTGEPKMSLWDVRDYLKPFFDKFVNYYETEHYIFVHGWIPCDMKNFLHPWYQNNRKLKYNPDWRSSSDEEWEAARWINGIKAGYCDKIIEPGKTIVCGHWHCSYGHYLKAMRDAVANGDSSFDVDIDEFGVNANFEPFEEDGVIAVDACTAHSGKANVVVLEDELLEG